jgi:NTE family protein
MEPELQQRLINWGYAVSDAALRRYFLPSLPRPTQFPLPGGVG